MRNRPIINADDLGLSAELNQTVAITFRQGWINSASLMPGMPGFDEAFSLIETEKLQERYSVSGLLPPAHI